MSRKYHGNSRGVSGGNHFLVADGASGLDAGGGSGVNGDLEAVRKREHGVRRYNAAFQIQSGLSGLPDGNAGGIHTAHLPGADAKRAVRNRLAVVGLTMLLAMFVFSFIGGVVSPYGQDQQFYTYTQMSKEYVGVTRNDKLRFVVADGQEFGSIAQSKGNEAIKKGEETFTYKDNDYEVETLNEDLYVFRQGRTVL